MLSLTNDLLTKIHMPPKHRSLFSYLLETDRGKQSYTLVDLQFTQTLMMTRTIRNLQIEKKKSWELKDNNGLRNKMNSRLSLWSKRTSLFPIFVKSSH